MDSKENLWTRRSNTSKLSLSMSHGDRPDTSTRTFSASRRAGGDSSHGGKNPFNAITPLAGTALASPTTAGSSAFGLGSGAFASFGSASKTPKTPGTAFDFKTAATSGNPPTTPGEKKEKPGGRIVSQSARKESLSTTASEEAAPVSSGPLDPTTPWPLKYTWVIWYRPPTPKNSDYEKSTKPLCRMSTAQQFWKVFVHLNRPSLLPTVSDYHFFKEGIRPVWEDEENRRGGKWIMRLKKGVADRYWEELLMALIGDQFAEAAEEVCGFVLSVRSGEDVFSIWTKNDGGRNIKIRETVKRVLNLPDGTVITWRSHDESIAQRSAIDQARQDKSNQHGQDKRRNATNDDAPREK
ncbi:IF4E-domain-containing protein [Aaosphaeria arxii CBS 175.79]|uniref:IF4E-domain-containing protein n=1 Tax=Aaosphaeria arxii CBS 175.79 TaxID=1450172 RepID=A0A6A5Y920_9PLEO|nr:IF4E-domain-containing protein [Aaosphaeria arxii CBS 175.79]KAF2021251.1 IF4E-domain-containing protein [Aaosphaeria arxii CBS 175.79]